MIACVLVREFAATLERYEQPALDGRPLIMVAGRERVHAASREAVSDGVLPGMSLRDARARCPKGHVLAARPTYYQDYYDWLVDNLLALLPRVEGGEGAGDGAGSTHHRAVCYAGLSEFPRSQTRALVKEIGQTVRRETGFEASLGVAEGKFTALAAASAVVPGRARLVPPGREAEAVGELPISTLELDRDSARQMHLLGIRTLGQFAALDRRTVVTRYGARGKRWHQLACGQDEQPLRPRIAAPHEQVARYFEGGLVTRQGLEMALAEMAGELLAKLFRQRMAATTLWLIIRNEDRTRQERRWRFSAPNADPHDFTRALVTRSRQCRFHCGVEFLEIIATGLLPISESARQLDLFVPPGRQAQRLEETIPHLARRYEACFYRAALQDSSTPVPEWRYGLQAVA